MPWPFEREYMQLALIGGAAVGASAPLIGAFLIQRRMSLVGDGLGHVAFAGVAGGLLLGVWPVWTALAATVACAVAIEWLRASGRASGDVALALFFYTGIAAGVVLVGLAGAFDAGLFSFLFGALLTIDAGEVRAIIALAGAVALIVLVARRALLAISVDEEWSTVAGLPSRVLGSSLAVVTAVTVVAAMRIVGLLLVAALMVLPVASAQLVARSFRGTLGWSSGIGVVSVIGGLAAARAWGLAPGATIVLVCAGFFAVATVVAGRASSASLPSALGLSRQP